MMNQLPEGMVEGLVAAQTVPDNIIWGLATALLMVLGVILYEAWSRVE